MRHTLSILILSLAAMVNAQASSIQISSFRLFWEQTNQHGGLARLVPEVTNYEPFMVQVADFERSLRNEDKGTLNFIQPVTDSHITFDPIHLKGIIGEESAVMYTSVGFAPFLRENIFSDNIYFPVAFLYIDNVSAVPEPGTYLLVMVGLAVIFVRKKKKPELS